MEFNKQANQGWIHELARTEMHPDAEALLNTGGSFDPHQLVEESGIEFLEDLRDQLNEYARLFNGLSEQGTRYQEIKVYSVAQTAADFMLFRNQIKLIFSNAAHGVIRISFSQHVRGAMAVNGQTQHPGSSEQTENRGQTQELLAQMGPFRDVFWTFQGERVLPEQVSKYYFTEFVKITRQVRRSKVGNQLLLDQIKALLQEKGLDL